MQRIFTKITRAILLPLAIGILCLLTFSCNREIRGEFGWSTQDDRGIGQTERKLLVETEYQLGREHLYFYDFETISWVYEIQGGSYDKEQFIASLYENNITPEPVEIDLRRVHVEDGPSHNFIRQSYDPLDPGKYLLKIAHGSIVVDQVEFQVIPPEGPSVLKPTGEIDEGDSEEEDEIIRYSSDAIGLYFPA